MSNLGFDVWGVVASALGTIALAPVIWSWFQPRLPTSMIGGVVEIHKETQELLATALRDGLITDPNEICHFKENLLDATISVDSLRAEVYVIKSWRHDVASWWRGVSKNIWMLRENLNSLRAELAGRASLERKKLAASKGPHNEPGPCSLSDHKDIRHSNASLPSPAGVSHQPAPAASHYPNHTAPHHHPGRCAHIASPVSFQCCHAQHVDEHIPCPPCSRTGFPGSDDHEPCPCHASSAAHPTQHHASETDLQSLFSLAFSRSQKWLGMRSKRGRNAKAQGTGSSKRPFDPFGIRTKKHGSSPARRDAMHPPLQDVLRLVRRLYGVDVGVRGGDKSSKSGSTVMLDPESLTPRYSEASDSDDDSDDWEEDRQ